MELTLSLKEFRLMKSFIEDQCGISLGEEKAYLIESRLGKILTDLGLTSFEELYNRISLRKEPEIIERIIDAITTNETSWFRDKTPWVILEGILLPGYIEKLRADKASRIRIWSAACSTGQEPYSVAMCIDNYLKKNRIDDIDLSCFEIVATDISKKVIQTAQIGKYDGISIVRGLNNTYRTKYFFNEGRTWGIDKKIRDSVSFKQFNLQNNFMVLGKFDVIFCRYVLIYFSEILKQEILSKIMYALKAEGALFTGSSEIINGYDDYFEMIDFGGGIYYRLKR